MVVDGRTRTGRSGHRPRAPAHPRRQACLPRRQQDRHRKDSCRRQKTFAGSACRRSSPSPPSTARHRRPSRSCLRHAPFPEQDQEEISADDAAEIEIGITSPHPRRVPAARNLDRHHRPAQRRQVHAAQCPHRLLAAIVSPIAGTTRDAVDEVVEYNGAQFRFVDTAGIRRKGKTHMMAEKLSVIMARRHSRPPTSHCWSSTPRKASPPPTPPSAATRMRAAAPSSSSSTNGIWSPPRAQMASRRPTKDLRGAAPTRAQVSGLCAGGLSLRSASHQSTPCSIWSSWSRPSAASASPPAR